MRLHSTKYRPEHCDDLYWAPLSDGTYLSEEIKHTPDNEVNVQRLLTLDSMSIFKGTPALCDVADKAIRGFQRARADEAKPEHAEAERELMRMNQVHQDVLTERNQLRERVKELEAEVTGLKADGGLRQQPTDDAAAAVNETRERELRETIEKLEAENAALKATKVEPAADTGAKGPDADASADAKKSAGKNK